MIDRGRWTRRGFAGLALGTVFAALMGCAKADRLTFENYSSVNNKLSTEADVRAALGEPDNILGSKWLYERPDKHLTVMIDFDKDGKIERKQWVDASGVQWHDTDDDKGQPKGK